MNARRYIGACVVPCRHDADNLRKYSFKGGVVDREGNFVAGSMLHEEPCGVGGKYDCSPAADHSVAIYIGFLLEEWGNCITDGLKKLWFLRTEEGRRLISGGAKVVFITLHNKPLPAYYKDVWNFAGYDCGSWRHITEPVRFDEVVVPDNSMMASPDERRVFDDRFLQEIESIKANSIREVGGKLRPIERIYFTRTMLKGNRKDFNERELERFFSRMGYTVVPPERFSVAEQVFLWANAGSVVATEGSISHPSMFMRRNSSIVILKKVDYFNGYQQACNEMSGVNATYVKANHSARADKSMPWSGPFYLCVTKELADYFGVDYRLRPVWLRPSYWAYCLRSLGLFHKLKLNVYILFLRLKLIRR